MTNSFPYKEHFVPSWSTFRFLMEERKVLHEGTN